MNLLRQFRCQEGGNSDEHSIDAILVSGRSLNVNVDELLEQPARLLQGREV